MKAFDAKAVAADLETKLVELWTQWPSDARAYPNEWNAWAWFLQGVARRKRVQCDACGFVHEKRRKPCAAESREDECADVSAETPVDRLREAMGSLVWTAAWDWPLTKHMDPLVEVVGDMAARMTKHNIDMGGAR